MTTGTIVYSIDVFSDTECKVSQALIWPSDAFMNLSTSYDCTFLGEGVQWGSVMVGASVPLA